MANLKAGKITSDMSYDQKLFQYTTLTKTTKPHFLQFTSLQRLSLAHLQNRLAKAKEKTLTDKAASDADLIKLGPLLHEYGMWKCPSLYSLQIVSPSPIEIRCWLVSQRAQVYAEHEAHRHLNS